MKKKIKILQTLLVILYFVGMIFIAYSCIYNDRPHMHILMIFGIFTLLLITSLISMSIYAYYLATSIEKDITNVLYRKEYVAYTKYYPQNSIICKSKDK